MIVMQQPSSLKLFFVMQGSVVPRIITKILGVSIISTLILLIDLHVMALPHVSISAMGVFGVALSLFLGFRNNAAYDRWWEARKLWGLLIADTRNIGRNVQLFVDDKSERKNIMTLIVAFVHLHRGFLRKAPRSELENDIKNWLEPKTISALLDHKNPADAALRAITERLSHLKAIGVLDGFGQITLSQTLSALGTAQAGCERIATTPLPFVYSLLVRRTTYLYCFILPFALIDSTSWFTPLFAGIVAYVFFGLQAVTNELEQPFSNVQNGLPLDAMCRTVEISISESLGQEPPESLKPINDILS